MAERICDADGCGDPVLARGWCSKHYQQVRRNEMRKGSAPCSVCGMSFLALSGLLCHTYKLHPEAYLELFVSRPVLLRWSVPSVVVVPLACGGGALVDEDDLTIVSGRRWTIRNSRFPYAVTSNGLKLHRLLMGERDGYEVDHRNGDTLDNRRANLRWATRQQNLANLGPKRNCRSRYKGVSWSTVAKMWQVQVAAKGVGYFRDEVDAARAYDTAALEKWGEFARLNFPEAP